MSNNKINFISCLISVVINMALYLGVLDVIDFFAIVDKSSTFKVGIDLLIILFLMPVVGLSTVVMEKGIKHIIVKYISLTWRKE